MFVFLRKAGQWVRAQQQCSVAEGVAERPSGVGVDLRDGGAISSRWTQSRQTLTYRSFEQKKGGRRRLLRRSLGREKRRDVTNLDCRGPQDDHGNENRGRKDADESG